jgi:hypothetical protein
VFGETALPMTISALLLWKKDISMPN